MNRKVNLSQEALNRVHNCVKSSRLIKRHDSANLLRPLPSDLRLWRRFATRQPTTPEDRSARLMSARVTKSRVGDSSPWIARNCAPLSPKTSATIELVEFVRLASVDPVYFETSYYVRPDVGGEKPYALLYRSLTDTGLVGVAQIAMHRREHIVMIRSGKSGLIAHTMYFSSEVRADQEYNVGSAELNPKEMELANMLVHALETDFNPEKFRDAYRERLERLIAAKVAGHAVVPAKIPQPAETAVDIMEALRKSLAGLKKPPEAAPARTRHPRRRSG